MVRASLQYKSYFFFPSTYIFVLSLSWAIARLLHMSVSYVCICALQENSKLVTWGMWRMGQEWQNQLCLSRMTSPNVTQTGMDFLCGAWTCLCVTNLTQTWHKRDTNLNLNFLWRMGFLCGVWIHTPHIWLPKHVYGVWIHAPHIPVKNLNFFPPLFPLSPYINFTSLTFSPPHSLFFPTLSPLSFLLFLYSIIFLLFTSILHI